MFVFVEVPAQTWPSSDVQVSDLVWFGDRCYREPGSRPRDEYGLTESGRALTLVIGALAGWGRVHRPRPDGTSPCFAGGKSGSIARLGFVTTDGEFALAELITQRTPDAQLTTP